MITLATDCLLFELANGESVPFSAEMLSIELEEGTEQWFDAEFVKHAAKAVFHYFKQEVGRQTVTVGEFAGALEKVLRGFKQGSGYTTHVGTERRVSESDLSRLASESGEGCELFFFPRLRDELREQLQPGGADRRLHA